MRVQVLGLEFRASVCDLFLSSSSGRGGGGGRGSLGTPVSSPPSFVNGFGQWNEIRINVISTQSNLIAELSLRTTWHSRCCT